MPFEEYIWSFVNHQPILNYGTQASQSQESTEMSRDLKKRGFKFVGPTTCYSMMQAIGMVIDHPVSSPEWISAHKMLVSRKGEDWK